MGIDWLSLPLRHPRNGARDDEAFGGPSSHGIIGQLASNEYPNVVGAYLKEGKSLIVSRVAIDQPYGLPLLDICTSRRVSMWLISGNFAVVIVA